MTNVKYHAWIVERDLTPRVPPRITRVVDDEFVLILFTDYRFLRARCVWWWLNVFQVNHTPAMVDRNRIDQMVGRATYPDFFIRRLLERDPDE